MSKINFKNLSNEEIDDLVKQALREKAKRQRTTVKKTGTYKKNLLSAKNINRKIDRLVNNNFSKLENAALNKNIKANIKASYNFKNIQTLKGTEIKKQVKKFNYEEMMFEKQWKKHYNKASSAYDFFYSKEHTNKLKEELRNKIKTKTKVNYLKNLSEIKDYIKNGMNDDEQRGYDRLFELYMDDLYPSKNEEFIQDLAKGGFNEQEIRELKDEYKKTGEYKKPRKIDYKAIFQKSLEQAVEEVAPKRAPVYLGKNISEDSLLGDLDPELFFS